MPAAPDDPCALQRGVAATLGRPDGQRFCDEHAERYLLAFVYGYLGDHDLLAARTEAEKYLLMGTLNLVECVAFVGSVAVDQ